jgi:hypothetical protein
MIVPLVLRGDLNLYSALTAHAMRNGRVMLSLKNIKLIKFAQIYCILPRPLSLRTDLGRGAEQGREGWVLGIQR